PDTLLYINRSASVFEIFARSRSVAYLQRILPILGLGSKADLEEVLLAFKEQKLWLPRWNVNSFSPSYLMGFDQLGSTK
ncbi:MAG: hypothetical protein KF886_15930, partial [Candidatus Hydrogenedentes bacterium]|nr:hypothetical protein [Candidatus Hydrogenedentota bacterium]